MNANFNYQDVPKSYIHCRNEQCPRTADCLRYQVGLRVTKETPFYVVINDPHVTGQEECSYFHAYQTIRMGLGIKYLYDDMTRKQEDKVRRRILRHLGRNHYYRIYREEQLIKPSLEAFIKQVFEEEEIGREPVFDRYIDCYDFTPDLH